MKSVILATIALIAGLAISACTVRSERTVVERPAPAQTAYVYTDTAPAPATTTVYVGP
jgi:hypothetical protein